MAVVCATHCLIYAALLLLTSGTWRVESTTPDSANDSTETLQVHQQVGTDGRRLIGSAATQLWCGGRYFIMILLQIFQQTTPVKKISTKAQLSLR